MSHAARIDVTLPNLNGRRQRRGLRFHWHRDPLAPDEVTRLGPIPITTPARSLLDLAAVLSTRAVEQALEQAEILRLLDHAELAALLVRRHNQPGAAKLRAIASAFAEPTKTRSELEDYFLELLERCSLPTPLVNHHVLGYEVDFLWPDRRLVVEADGRGTHLTPQAFERDRHRDVKLKIAGYDVARFTYRQIVYDFEHVADAVRAVLTHRPS